MIIDGDYHTLGTKRPAYLYLVIESGYVFIH